MADELNYYEQGAKTENKARDLVMDVSRRMESRFLQHGGDIPGIAMYLSQTRTTSDFLERRIREKKDQRGVRIIRGPRWAFATKGYEHPDGFHPGEDTTFRVFVGTETADPRILDAVAATENGGYTVSPVNAEEVAPEGRVIEVPAVHHRAFCDDIYGSLRNIADEPSGSFTPFFSRREIVESAFDESLPFPFTAQVLACYERSGQRLQDVFDHRLLTHVSMGHLEPIRHPEAPRYIHLDLSIRGDVTGFAMVHPSAHYRSDRPFDPTGEGADTAAPVGEGEVIKTVEADFYVGLKAGPSGEPIDFRAVRVFIDFLSRCGFWVRLVTADAIMLSHDMLQRLRDMGFTAETQSVDRTSQPYRDVRQVMNEARVKLPYPQLLTPAAMGSREAALRRVTLFQEFIGLEHDVHADKVDHREVNPDGSRGSKDIADAVVGASFRCLLDKVNPSDAPTTKTFRQVTNARLARYLERVPWER